VSGKELKADLHKAMKISFLQNYLKMKKIIFLLFLLTAIMAKSQNYTPYQTIRQDAINKFNEGDYFSALETILLIRKKCDIPKKNDLNLWEETCTKALKEHFALIVRERKRLDSIADAERRESIIRLKTQFDLRVLNSIKTNKLFTEEIRQRFKDSITNGLVNYRLPDSIYYFLDSIEYIDSDSLFIRKLRNLKYIKLKDLDDNSLIQFFQTADSLKNLKIIKLYECNPKLVPLKYQSYIVDIDNSYNKSSILSDILDFKHLKILNIYNSKIDSFPSGFFNLTQLTNIDLSYNLIKTIPDQISQLTNLSKLNLEGNDINHISYRLFTLQKLQEIFLNGDSIENISFPKQSNIKLLRPIVINSISTDSTKLNIKTKRIDFLTKIPELANNIVSINLSDRFIDTISFSSEHLNNLRCLNLSGNFFDNLTVKFEYFKRLERFDISDNCFKVLPQNMNLLISLKEFIYERKFYQIDNSGIMWGKPFILKDIKFSNNSDGLFASSFTALNRLAALMIKNPKLIIKITGHTDNVGSDRYNERLSLARATSVKEYLVNKRAIDEKRIFVEGKGEKEPIVINDTPEGQAKNRRIEVRFALLDTNKLTEKKELNIPKDDQKPDWQLEIPPDFMFPASLQLLNLNNQNIGRFDKKILLLAQLKELDLLGNQIKEVPKGIDKLRNLEQLDLQNNQLTKLPRQIKRCKSLRELYLQGNPIQAKEQEKIKKWLPDCKVYF
jgi:Leucine-rich repeat (LRR) protein